RQSGAAVRQNWLEVLVQCRGGALDIVENAGNLRVVHVALTGCLERLAGSARERIYVVDDVIELALVVLEELTTGLEGPVQAVEGLADLLFVVGDTEIRLVQKLVAFTQQQVEAWWA